MKKPLGKPPRHCHTKSVDQICEELACATTGLSDAQVAERRRQFGANRLTATRTRSGWSVFAAQFANILVIILLIATAFSAFVGHEIEAIAIAVIVLFAVFLGFIQEYRAEKAIEALRTLSAPTASVSRNGEQTTIAAEELVPGDIIWLKVGDRVPADARLIEAINLNVEESALTGESLAVEKQCQTISDENAPVGDRTNLVFSGTSISYGRGRAIVIATGMETEFGKIAEMLEQVDTAETPLQKNLDKVGRRLGIAGLVVVVVIVGLGLVRDDLLREQIGRTFSGEIERLPELLTSESLVQLIIFGIALAVAVVPEALPAVVTISLALGVRRMANRNALVRRLPAVETLGCTSIICSDKTGTLTRDEMTVRRIVAGGDTWEVTGSGYEPVGEFRLEGEVREPNVVVRQLLEAAVLASDAKLINGDKPGSNWSIQGDPTEAALVVAAAKAHIDKSEVDRRFPRVAEIPFTSESKRMTTMHSDGETLIADAKGAPEAIVTACSRQLHRDGTVSEFSQESQQRVLRQAEQLAAGALRVLAIATHTPPDREHAESDMTFLGLVGMIDPPRPEAKDAVHSCQRAGIRPIMITGDHPSTARAIADELGILSSGNVLSGKEFDHLDDAGYREQIAKINVYARVSPAHKLRVVSALQNQGAVVSMTGDGVNDAPALKKADIGIAMGITGTDVTKEAAAVMLTDDNFATIVAAIEEGRIVFGNIKKYLMYLLSSNIGEIGLMAGASLAGLPLPLTAVQLLYVNLATDGLPALALAVDPPESDLMEQPPRDPKVGIFTRPVVMLMTIGGIWSALVNFCLFYWALYSGRSLEEAMTMTFTSLVLIQFFKAYNFRSDHRSVLERPFANKWLNYAIFWELALLVGVLYLPLFQIPFRTVSMPWADWLLIALASLTISPVLEVSKWFMRRLHHS